MMNADCFAFMSSMGGWAWLMPITFLMLMSLTIASLVKYLLSHPPKGDRS